MWPEEIENISFPRDVHLGPSRTKDGYHSTSSPPLGWSGGFRCNDRHPIFVLCFLYSVLKFIPLSPYSFTCFHSLLPHRCKWTNLREKTAFKKNGVKKHSQILKNNSIIIFPLCYFFTELVNWNSLSPKKPLKSHVHPWTSREMSPGTPLILANWFTSWSLMQLPGFHLWIEPANSLLVKLSWLTEYHSNISQRCSERNWKGSE